MSRIGRLRLLWAIAIVGLLGPCGCGTLEKRPAPERSACTVASIHDGVTLRAECVGERLQVRLYCIDAPELGQRPWGQASRDYLRALLPRGTSIALRIAATDRYGRQVAEVRREGESLNLRMVRDGLAAVYPRYCGDRAYYRAEAQAKQEELGIWNRPGLQRTPWEYRH